MGENLAAELARNDTTRADIDGPKVISLFREIQQTYKDLGRILA